jgi:AbrB family looped-hinge helix DNA binding protein
MANSAVMSSKGQIVIPAKLRKEMGLKAGARVSFRKHGKGLMMEPTTIDAVLELCGKFAQYPLEEDLIEERRKWDERMELM